MVADSKPLIKEQLQSHSEKLRRRLSSHAMGIADATENCMEEDDLEASLLGRLAVRIFGRAQVLQITLPIFLEPAFKSRARYWAGVYLLTMVVQSLLQVLTTNAEMAVASSVEYMDGESFFYCFMAWLILQALSLVRRAVKEQSRWEVRMMVQWRLQFRLGHALFTEDAFHHLQVNMFKVDETQNIPANPAPEGLLCRDSFLWLHEFTNSVDIIISEIVGCVTAIYTVSRWSYGVTIYLLLTVPVRGYLVLRMMPKPLFYLHRYMTETSWDLMFVMARVQHNAEQIALFRGGLAEFWRFASVLKILFRNQMQLLFWTQLHQVFVTLAGTAFMFPILVKLLYDVCDRGFAVSAAMSYCMQVYMVNGHLSLMGQMSHQFVRYQQTVSNMNMLINAGKIISQEHRQRRKDAEDFSRWDKYKILLGQRGMLDVDVPVVQTHSLLLWAPREKDGVVMMENFNMELWPGQSMLIVGDTGTGKSLLLRAIHGLWHLGNGRVTRCHNSQLMCMPERPFTFKGTLRQNLLYPEVEDDDVTDEAILKTLKALNLSHLADSESLDRQAPWHSILSLGQQQRLGFARILLRPQVKLVLLDEATSALDMKNERNVYRMLRDQFPCYISVGHRPSVREYHTHVVALRFREDRSHVQADAEFKPIQDFDFASVENHSHGDKGSAEEKLWARSSRRKAEEKGKQTDAGPEEGETQELLDESLEEECEYKPPELPSLERRWGGLDLLIRASRDIIWPMLTQREIILPMLLIFGCGYTIAFVNLAMEGWFGYPYALVINIMQTRNAAVCWGFFFRVILVYYPVQLLFQIATRVAMIVQGSFIRIALKWYLGKIYLDQKSAAYYHMSVARLVEGNPGQRIVAWDADAATVYLVSMLTTVSHAVFGVYISCKQLWVLDKTALTLFLVHIWGGVIFHVVMGNATFRAYRGWLHLTMSLHSSVLHTREHSEAIVLLQGCDVERRQAFEKMDQAITPGSQYLWTKDAGSFAGSAYFSNISDTVITLLTGPAVLSGRMSFYMQTQMRGIIGMGSGGIQAMLQEILLNSEGQVAVERLWELTMIIKAINAGSEGSGRFGGELTMTEDSSLKNVVELRNVCLRTPVSSGSVAGALLLAQNVTLHVPKGDSLLIAGESGIGKSSMLRAVAGLWRHGSGSIVVANAEKSFFIPQRPYVFVGNLRENLLYPDVERTDVSDDKLSEIANNVGLGHLLYSPGLGEDRREIERRANVNSEKDRGWVWRLSLGELQRLNFGRLLLREGTQLVFLDEATSALSIEIEEAMYDVVNDRSSSYVSVAHRPQLRKFHKRAFVMVTDHTRPVSAACKTACRVMSMEEYEQELETMAAKDAASTAAK